LVEIQKRGRKAAALGEPREVLAVPMITMLVVVIWIVIP
jgi:hypothetical protein